MTEKQISVFLENRYGQLHEITDILARANINLKALNIAETRDYGIVRILVDDVANPVQVVAVPNVAGGLNDVLGKIADANIDIEYMYSTVDGDNGNAKLVFKVSDEEKFKEILG